jgi:hypothetical protein
MRLAAIVFRCSQGVVARRIDVRLGEEFADLVNMFGGERVGIVRKFRKMSIQMNAQTTAMALVDFCPELFENRLH